MPTQLQSETSRLNAQRSTGPSSVEGKAVTRFNSLKHGIDAQSLVIPGEDPAQLQTLADDYHTQFQPEGPVESFLLTTLVHCDWNKRRYTRIQSILLRQYLPPYATAEAVDFALAEIFLDNTPETRALQRVARRLATEHRNYMRAFTELRRQQKQRLAQSAEPVAATKSQLRSEPKQISVPTPSKPAENLALRL